MGRRLRTSYRVLLYLWASPATGLGLLLVGPALLGGGSARIVDGVIEATGSIVTRLLKGGLPFVGPVAALTLGHVVLGCDTVCLTKTRAHERVHVRQYERWGPLMIPLYLLAGLVVYIRRGNPYRDNPFEKEAVEKTAGPRG
jgi:hypothetical protein